MEIVTEKRKTRGRFVRNMLLIVLTVIILFFLIVQIIPVKKNESNTILREGGKPDVIAHRGGAGIAPENTLEAFKLSDSLGVDMLEFDVRLSKDGQVVVMHDETIDRTTNGEGKISEYSVEELKSFDAGYHFVGPDGSFPYRGKGVTIPTLTEVFESYSHLPMVIEIKENDTKLTEKFADIIFQYGMEDKVIIASFYDEIANYFYDITNGEVAISTSSATTKKYVIFQKLFLGNIIPLKEQALQLPTHSSIFDLTTKKLIDAAHERNIAVQYWTINDLDMVEYLLEQGADGIMTDYPNKVIHLLRQKGVDK
ncbi:glycerophosphodiester phosphodiesterase [Cytobacillus sp. Hm23]